MRGLTAPPAPAPDDLIARLDAAIEAKWARWGLHFNRDDYLDFMRSELAARDAEIAAERKRADMLWQECEDLQELLRDWGEAVIQTGSDAEGAISYRCQLCGYEWVDSAEEHAPGCLAAERTQEAK
jgi:rubrerythrin